jgi:hypothetical protein
LRHIVLAIKCLLRILNGVHCLGVYE